MHEAAIGVLLVDRTRGCAEPKTGMDMMPSRLEQSNERVETGIAQSAGPMRVRAAVSAMSTVVVNDGALDLAHAHVHPHPLRHDHEG